jgi:hypothetical protein
VKRACGRDVTTLPDAGGAPRIAGDDRVVSLSHDGDRVAVALSRAPIGVDVCLRRHRDRLARAMRRLDLDVPEDEIGGIDPVTAWAALEATLKLHHLRLARLLESRLTLRRLAGDAIAVDGLGRPARVRIHETADCVVGGAS